MVEFKAIPRQVINEGAAFTPLSLLSFIDIPEGSGVPLRFTAELVSGASLPKGMICTTDGILSGIPAKGTAGDYEILLTLETDIGATWETTFFLTIKPVLTVQQGDDYFQFKAQVWDALGQNLPLPELEALYKLPVNIGDVYYLLERWATMRIWDAYNLDPPSEKKLLALEGVSPHFNVYDCGCYIVASPKVLISEERTLADALMTARAMAREVYKRGWAIEFGGFDKMVRAAWVEIQHLTDQYGKPLEIVHYAPDQNDITLYVEQNKAIGMNRNLGG